MPVKKRKAILDVSADTEYEMREADDMGMRKWAAYRLVYLCILLTPCMPRHETSMRVST